MKCPRYPGKKRYSSLAQANRTLLRRLKDTIQLRSYQCGACHGYHLTSQVIK